MNMRQLEIFLAVSESLSITKTAQMLYLSQPAISKTIRELEEAIGIQLFDRINNKLSLNESGRVFRIKAMQLMADYVALENFKSTGVESVPLRIGVSLTIAANSLDPAITSFRKKYADTPLKIYCENVKQIQERLNSGEIDIAFTEGFESNVSYYQEVLSQYKLYIVGKPKMIQELQTLPLREFLLNTPFLLREKGSTLRDCFDEATHQIGIEVVPFIESINTEVLTQSVQSGLGVTVLPEPFVKPLLESGVLNRIEVGNLSMKTVNYAVMMAGKTISEVHREMIDCFKFSEQK
ncbi:LysR family transcriptional regulator [Erysipelothrix sp. HDW6C]|uniref:LysR family transcriptional regulator n=1 Tax=Erysipelothrix sp. HDW6C TaxID=2714930 RepID=UPI00140B64EC|nr:LysR family transcriptional regulator [Erysipelothrix sp. HDW6C]QIK70565.1 LysR family transcriptional regulator [Erysipelothrix sp. HDW6C]